MAFQHLVSAGLVVVLTWPLDTHPVEHDRDVAVGPDPIVTVVGGDNEDHRRLDEALSRFRRAGLELPDLDVHFHDADTPCRGHLGLFQQSRTPWRILVCSDLDFVPTHEIAHAWEAAHLDEADRASYVEAHGLETWSSPPAAWRERGVEHAAFSIQQNLMASTPDLSSPTWQERIAAYEILTGTTSPLREPP